MDRQETFKKVFKHKVIKHIKSWNTNPCSIPIWEMQTRQVIQYDGDHTNYNEPRNTIDKHGSNIFFETIFPVLIYEVNFVTVASDTAWKEQIIVHPKPKKFNIQNLGDIGSSITER